MANKPDAVISSKQLIFVITGASVGTGFLSLPRTVSAISGQDAWLSVLLGSLLPLVSLYLIERLGRKMTGLNFVTMNQTLLGKWAGSFMVLLFVAYVIYFQSIVVRIFAEVTGIYLLPRTPLTVILLLIIIPVVYIGGGGARVVGRMSEIIFFILLPLLFILLISLLQADITNLMPVGESGLLAIAKGALATNYTYAGIGILLVFYFLVERKEDVVKAGLMGTGIDIVTYLLATVLCILVLGSEVIKDIMWPGIRLFRLVQISSAPRLEFFILALWMGLGARPAIIMGFAASLSLAQLIKIDMNRYFRLVILAVALGTYGLALVPDNIFAVFAWSRYAGMASIGINIAYPLLLHFCAFLKRKELGSTA